MFWGIRGSEVFFMTKLSNVYVILTDINQCLDTENQLY